MDYRIEQLRYRLREEPDSRVFYQLGELLRREGEIGEAVEILRTGLGHHPRYVAAWVALGRALNGAGDDEEAERAFARALELDPENSVAARSIGDIAVAREDWVRAVKALKLARVLAPGDTTLDTRIADVEARLAEVGMLEPTDRVSPPSATPPEAVPAPRAPRVVLPVVSVSDDDPFAFDAERDTGVWESGFDVFEPPARTEEEAEESPGEERPFASDDRVRDEEAEAALVETAVEPEDASSEGWAAEAMPVEAAEGDDDRDLGDGEDGYDDEGALADDVPLPTMTLARLALQQRDSDLAERTLVGVLERDPDHGEARSMLLSLRSTQTQPVTTERIPSRTAAKVAALQGWLETIRLSAERRA